MATLIFLLYSLTFAVHADVGSGIDPDGRRITAYSDEGPGLCPVGKHMSTTSDSGGGMDPNG